ncbi:hypothetical protein AMAG_09796 [Allomyces macrogynus ATCC 38327]|uniref:DUF4246 domain-containing protein n=1 Tax=Allomyces macrogynus (strain ATCC 38327) TaxID=578462 RepID=A0A0L0SU10_ALLM3|nr:hypothetical protein AMAG_09796 [Allomyces macrogynus ATCC 38327]|eukprot:KNE65824.1 hypothetical protein AMAG_09796 [Allomyces macrogynus ATCC 38327]
MKKPQFIKEDRRGAEIVYGLKDGRMDGSAPTALLQDQDMVTALAGRLVVFPNTYQRQLMPCELVEKSWPGHVKLLCRKSTSRVALQQAEWVADAWACERRAFSPKLPREVVDMIVC